MINKDQVESLIEIVGENLSHSDIQKRNEAINAFYRVFGERRVRELQQIIEPYIPKLTEILREENNFQIRKTISLILNNMDYLPKDFHNLLLIYKLGIEENSVSSKLMEKLLEFPNNYAEIKEAIFEMMHSPEKYKKMLATGMIVHCSEKLNYLSQEQLEKDWLQIIRNLIQESKIPEVRLIALKALANIAPDIYYEKELLQKELVYNVVFDLLNKFQPNIQVPLSRIMELTSPTINTEIAFLKKNFRVEPTRTKNRAPQPPRQNKPIQWDITKEFYEETLREIVKNDDLSGEFFPLEQVFVKKDGKERYSLTVSSRTKSYICYNCGMPIEKENTKCSSCGKEILKCNVCKLPISFGEETGTCKFCESKGHLSHLQEWLKIKGTCPTCQKKLTIDEIVPIFLEEKKT